MGNLRRVHTNSFPDQSGLNAVEIQIILYLQLAICLPVIYEIWDLILVDFAKSNFFSKNLTDLAHYSTRQVLLYLYVFEQTFCLSEMHVSLKLKAIAM